MVALRWSSEDRSVAERCGANHLQINRAQAKERGGPSTRALCSSWADWGPVMCVSGCFRWCSRLSSLVCSSLVDANRWTHSSADYWQWSEPTEGSVCYVICNAVWQCVVYSSCTTPVSMVTAISGFVTRIIYIGNMTIKHFFILTFTVSELMLALPLNI